MELIEYDLFDEEKLLTKKMRRHWTKRLTYGNNIERSESYQEKMA